MRTLVDTLVMLGTVLLLSWCWWSFCPCHPLCPAFVPLWRSWPLLPSLPSHRSKPVLFSVCQSCSAVCFWFLTLISGHSAKLGLLASYTYTESLSYMVSSTVSNGISLLLNICVFLECYSVFTNVPSKVELYMMCAHTVWKMLQISLNWLRVSWISVLWYNIFLDQFFLPLSFFLLNNNNKNVSWILLYGRRCTGVQKDFRHPSLSDSRF